MKKDIFLALASGFFLGGLFAIFLVNFPKFTTNLSLQEKTNLISPSPPPPTLSNATLEIENPKDEELIETETVDISGKTTPESLVILENEKEIKVTTSDKDGFFQGKIALIEGKNDLLISAYHETGNVMTKTLTLYYTAEKL